MPMPGGAGGGGGAVGQRLAVDQHLALARRVHAVEDLHQRRLAGAVLAEQGVDLAGPHVEVDVVVGHEVAEALRDAAGLE